MINLVSKRTKIITTIGPASESLEIMRKLFEEGMTTIRLNFSHGTREGQAKKIVTARKLQEEVGVPISVMLDTKGPEIRIGKFKEGSVLVTPGQEIKIYTSPYAFENRLCEQQEMTTSYDMSQDLTKGKPILIDDGKLELTVRHVEQGMITAIAKNKHLVKSNKRINLPGTKFSMPFLSETDKGDIEFGISKGIDFIAASFVNTAEDIKEIKKILKAKNAEHIQIFSKIESQYAVDHFDKILEETDGVMVARGDLGLEIPYYNVPIVQKDIIRRCRENGKPVIVATQMLDSMENNPHPTRAEVTDVYLSVELGADATMLSGETASGNYPVEAVETMSAIDKRAEKEFYNKLYYPVQLNKVARISLGARARLAEKVARKAIDGQYRFAIVMSRTGDLLREVSKFRPNTAIIGVTNTKNQITQFGITSSVFMYLRENGFEEIKNDVEKNAKKIVAKYGALPGDKFLVLDSNKILEFTF
ncbi:MAG: pyruvate kinase [Mycoplasma sp.]|nr:pyruvate kinase [Mycoplasma sp.]